jgi:NADH dehydrogenase
VLVHSHNRVLNGEMPEELGVYAHKVMAKRGVEFIFNQHMQTATPEFALLEDGTRIQTRTLISTVPSSPNPVVLTIDVPKDRGRIQADLKMQVQGTANVWALGDCALIPSPTGEGFCPPTAQFAIRQAALCARNILASIDGGEQQEFDFHELGKMASLGHRRAIARLFNRIDLEGFFAWIFWRAVYWAKLPGFDRKLRVGASWMLDLVCGAELVQTKLDAPQGMTEQHFEPGEFVVHQGDPENELFIITAGKAEAVQGAPGAEQQVVDELTVGQCFGASSVLDRQTYPASIRCVEPLTVTVYRRDELIPLLSIPEIKNSFEAL